MQQFAVIGSLTLLLSLATAHRGIYAQAATPAADAESNLIDDDGKTLWDSPTHGRPLKLAYLPPGCQIILAVRPAELLARPEGEKTIAALSQIAASAIQGIEKMIGIPLHDIEQLLIGWQVTPAGAWDTALVVTAKPATAHQAFESRRAGASLEQHDDETYLFAGDHAYWQPKSAEGRVLVVASKSTMPDILDLAGGEPPLRRDIERLLSHTDASRHVTLLVAPSFLFSDGANLFTGELSRLRDPLFWFLGDEFTAAELSMHWGDDFFIELAATPTLDLPANKAVNQLSQRLNKTPDRLAAFIATLAPSEYSRALVARFPDMLRTLATYARHRAGRELIIFRSYLPAAAGQNLLLGAELTLAEAASGATATASSSTTTDSPKSVLERLQKKTSLRFTKDTLEAALKMLADDIGVEIAIRGPDLQLDGITKNQSFGIDLSDKPADEILVQILRLANPDKTATGPGDPKQKLVYVVGPKSPGGPDIILVTTRAAAKKRGDTLPDALQSKPPAK